MDKFLDAYQQWPPSNQMIFAAVVVVIAAVVGLVLAWWIQSFFRDIFHYVAVWRAGWPDRADAKLVVPLRTLPVPRTQRAALASAQPALTEGTNGTSNGAAHGAGNGTAPADRFHAPDPGAADHGWAGRLLDHGGGPHGAFECRPRSVDTGPRAVDRSGCYSCDTRAFHGGL